MAYPFKDRRQEIHTRIQRISKGTSLMQIKSKSVNVMLTFGFPVSHGLLRAIIAFYVVSPEQRLRWPKSAV